MDERKEIKFYKKSSPPIKWEPNAIYAILPANINETTVWITDLQGIPIKIIDVSGGGVNSLTGTGVTGTSLNPTVNISHFVSNQVGNRIYLSSNDGKLQVNQVTSPDGSLTITETLTETQLQLSSAITAIINSALQAGDNVSNLVNDAGYITLSDVPVFNPSLYDLTDFTNTDADPFVRQSDITTGNTNLGYTASPTNGVVTSDTGTDAIIPLADNTNAGLLSPSEKADIASALQSGDNVSALTNDAGYVNQAGVRDTPLTDLSTATGGAITPTDKVIEAFGKIQNTLTNIFSASVFGAAINALTGKTTPVDADGLAIFDSAASNAAKKLTWANLKATLKAYFDPIYIKGNVRVQGAAIASMAGSMTYYIGGSNNISPLGTSRYKMLFPVNSTSFRANVFLYINGTTYGSGEAIQVVLHDITTNTSHAIGNISITGHSKGLLATVNATVTAGNEFEIRLITPAFVTSPQQVVSGFDIDFF